MAATPQTNASLVSASKPSALARLAVAARPRPAVADLVVRVAAGALMAWYHGVHKVVEAIAYFRDGTPWKLVDEIAELGLPLAVPNAVIATVVQTVGGVLVCIGLFTRPAAALVAGSLAVAVYQNLHAGRDPQLTLLYLAAFVAIALAGAGRWSVDARLAAGRSHD
jgi:putative oxidoreductase